MEKVGLRVGVHDIVSVFLGLLSWLFDIPEWIKLLITVLIMLITIFLALSKNQRSALADGVSSFFTNYLIPFVGGFFKYAAITTIVINVVDALFNIHLINHGSTQYNIQTITRSWIEICFYSLGHLTTWGYVILVGVSFFGGANAVSEEPKHTPQHANPVSQTPTQSPDLKK